MEGVCTPSNLFDFKSNKKIGGREGGSCSGSSELEDTAMVATVEELSSKRSVVGKCGGDFSSRESDEEKGNKTASWGASDGKIFLEKVKDARLKPGLGFMVMAMENSGWRNGLIEEWFLAQSKSTTRNRLKAGGLFGQWCMKKGLTPEKVALEKQPQKLVEECIRWVYDMNGSYASAEIVRTSVSAWYRDWFGIDNVGSSGLVQHTLRSGSENRVPAGRKKRIWDIGILIEGIRVEGVSSLDTLCWRILIGRLGMMLLIYTCCRIKDMFYIVPERSVWKTSENTCLLAMRTKDGRGRLKFKVLLETSEEAVNPIRTVEEYRRRVSSYSNVGGRFFLNEDGTPISSVEALSREFLVPYMREKGVPDHFTPYSTKTAVITALFNQNLSKDQVSAFTGHTSNSNTALKHYHDTTNDWLGHRIGSLKASPPGESASSGEVAQPSTKRRGRNRN
jgi:hypothetical protein